jgi:hypothetical protein
MDASQPKLCPAPSQHRQWAEIDPPRTRTRLEARTGMGLRMPATSRVCSRVRTPSTSPTVRMQPEITGLERRVLNIDIQVFINHFPAPDGSQVLQTGLDSAQPVYSSSVRSIPASHTSRISPVRPTLPRVSTSFTNAPVHSHSQQLFQWFLCAIN